MDIISSSKKDELIRAIISADTGRRFWLSSIDLVSLGIGMGEAVEIARELEQRGLISDIRFAGTDAGFLVSGGLQTLAEKGGLETEHVVYRAELQKAILEIEKLKGEINPSLYGKIMKILIPFEKLAIIGSVLL